MLSLLVLLASAQAKPLVAIVVVDQEARESGYALEIDGWLVEDALPVDVSEGEQIVLVDPVGETEPLDVRAGEAWEITGPEGEAWMALLDEEIRTDRIAVRGSAPSIEALAASLDAEVVVDGKTTYLVGEDILLDAPWVDDEVALKIAEIGLVRAEPEPDEDADAPVEAPSPGRVAVPVAVAPVRAVAAPPAAPLPSEGTATEAPAPAAHVPDEAPTPLVENAEPVPFLPTNDGLDRAPYAGLHLCRDDVLWLHPSGVYGFRGVDGVWSVASPGVVRLLTDRGEVLFRAAISPETGFCRDVWSPEETGQAMPEGYERFGTAKRRARQAPMGLAD